MKEVKKSKLYTCKKDYFLANGKPLCLLYEGKSFVVLNFNKFNTWGFVPPVWRVEILTAEGTVETLRLSETDWENHFERVSTQND